MEFGGRDFDSGLIVKAGWLHVHMATMFCCCTWGAWEKRFVVVRNNTIFIFSGETVRSCSHVRTSLGYSCDLWYLQACCSPSFPRPSRSSPPPYSHGARSSLGNCSHPTILALRRELFCGHYRRQVVHLHAV
jgi:hypothetical protein